MGLVLSRGDVTEASGASSKDSGVASEFEVFISVMEGCETTGPHLLRSDS